MGRGGARGVGGPGVDGVRRAHARARVLSARGSHVPVQSSALVVLAAAGTPGKNARPARAAIAAMITNAISAGSMARLRTPNAETAAIRVAERRDSSSRGEARLNAPDARSSGHRDCDRKHGSDGGCNAKSNCGGRRTLKPCRHIR